MDSNWSNQKANRGSKFMHGAGITPSLIKIGKAIWNKRNSVGTLSYEGKVKFMRFTCIQSTTTKLFHFHMKNTNNTNMKVSLFSDTFWL